MNNAIEVTEKDLGYIKALIQRDKKELDAWDNPQYCEEEINALKKAIVALEQIERIKVILDYLKEGKYKEEMDYEEFFSEEEAFINDLWKIIKGAKD